MNKNIHKPFGIGYLGFTLAEMMVVMLILSIVMAAMAPVMTTRNKLDQSSPWSWANNGSDAYYGIGDAQVAMIGQEEAKDNDIGSRLVINAPDGKKHILLKQGDTTLGYLNMTNNSNVLTGSILGNTTQGSRSVAVGISTTPSGGNSTAIGYASKSTGEASTAVGSNSTATGDRSSALNVSQSPGYGSTALGWGNSSRSDYSLSAGYSNTITDTATNSIALGSGNQVNSPNSIAIGRNIQLNSAANEGIVSIGMDSSADYRGTAIGYNTSAARYSTVVGSGAKITEDTEASATILGSEATAYNYGTALGHAARATGAYSFAVGYWTQASGESSIAIGSPNTVSSNTASIAIGKGSQALANNSIAFGNGAISNNTNNIAIGTNASAESEKSIAMGLDADASVNSIAIGPYTKAANDSIAIGFTTQYDSYNRSTEATGGGAIAIGRLAKAIGTNNIAIGLNACQYVTGSNKVCIGANSGPASSYPYRNDQEERIFIGSAPKYISSGNRAYISKNGNIAAAVLEVHNLKSDEPRVVINGNLIVRGSIAVKPSNRNTFVQMFVGGSPGGEVDQFQEGTEFNINAITDIMGMQFSDRRLKFVGKENTSGLDKIRELKVFNYTFKKDEKKTPHVGVIAQDLQKVFPDAVSKAKDGFLRIRFEDMFYAMINAIKELDSRITALEKENQQLKEQNKALDARLKAIEAKLK